MSHACGYPLATGRACAQLVADPRRTNCWRHQIWTEPDDRSDRCQMQEIEPGAWRCLTHSGQEWAVARTLGAHPPCRVPLTSAEKQQLAQSGDLGADTAEMLLSEALDPQSWMQGEELARSLAGNAHSPESVLRQLATNPAYEVRYQVARNESAPPSLLVQLAHSGALIYAAVGNPSAPASLLDECSHHPDPVLRRHILDHPNVPESVVDRLCADPADSVRDRAAWLRRLRPASA